MNLSDVQRIVSKYDPETILYADRWDEDRTPFRAILYLEANSYQVEQLFAIPTALPIDGNTDYVLSPRKNFAYRNVLHTENHLLPLNMNGRKGIAFWTDSIVIPALIDMNIQTEDGGRFPEFVPEQTRTIRGATGCR